MRAIETPFGRVAFTRETHRHISRRGHRPVNPDDIRDAMNAGHYEIIGKRPSAWKGAKAVNIIVLCAIGATNLLVVLKSVERERKLLCITAYEPRPAQVAKWRGFEV